MVNHRKRTKRGGAEPPALNIKVASFVVVLSINVLIVKRTNAFITNATAWAISQEFVYQKLRKSRRRLRQCAKTKKNTRTLNNLIGDEKANFIVLVNGVRAICLIDTGTKFNHIDSKFCQQAKLNYEENSDILKLELAVKNSAVKTKRFCSTSVGFQGRYYNNVKFLVLENLLWYVILGCEFLSQHKSVKVDFGGPESSLKLGALSILRGILVKPVLLFEYLNPNIRPITTKRRGY